MDMRWGTFCAAAITAGHVGVRVAAGYYDNTFGFVVTSEEVMTTVDVQRNGHGQSYVEVGAMALRFPRGGKVSHQAVYLFDQWHTLDKQLPDTYECKPGTSVASMLQRVYLQRQMNSGRRTYRHKSSYRSW